MVLPVVCLIVNMKKKKEIKLQVKASRGKTQLVTGATEFKGIRSLRGKTLFLSGSQNN